jgi:hypothetical protein
VIDWVGVLEVTGKVVGLEVALEAGIELEAAVEAGVELEAIPKVGVELDDIGLNTVELDIGKDNSSILVA